MLHFGIEGATIYFLKNSEKHFFDQHVITARSDSALPSAMKEYLANYRILLEGVFPVNNRKLSEALQVETLNAAQKKAVVMAALIQLYLENNPEFLFVDYLEDGDDNLIAAMQLLPELFPTLCFRFFDVVHTGQGVFKMQLIARKEPHHPLKDPYGKELIDVEGYQSDDRPLRDELLFNRLLQRQLKSAQE